jgi:lactate permease
VWDAIFILYVIWPVLLLYQVTKQARAYDALRQGIARFSPNEPFIILALSWVFASFLQGIAGFGAPVAVVVPLLIAIGVKPVCGGHGGHRACRPGVSSFSKPLL